MTTTTRPAREPVWRSNARTASAVFPETAPRRTPAGAGYRSPWTAPPRYRPWRPLCDGPPETAPGRSVRRSWLACRAAPSSPGYRTTDRTAAAAPQTARGSLEAWRIIAARAGTRTRRRRPPAPAWRCASRLSSNRTRARFPRGRPSRREDGRSAWWSVGSRRCRAEYPARPARTVPARTRNRAASGTRDGPHRR